ncbi:hypothetical protein [Frigoribacterium salinisoli]
MAERLREPTTSSPLTGTTPPESLFAGDELRVLLVKEVHELRIQLMERAAQLHDEHLRHERTRRQHEADLRELALLRVRILGRQHALAVLVVTGIVSFAAQAAVGRVTTEDDVHLLVAAVLGIVGLTVAFRAVDAEHRARRVHTIRPLLGRRTLPSSPPAPDVPATSTESRRAWVARARAVRTVRAYREVFGPDGGPW